MLTGQLSGVTITQSSGNPGQDQGTIRVRGVGSFGATPDPLVLVDGLPGSLNDLNPADIESISILKDASSKRHLWFACCEWGCTGKNKRW